MKSEYEAVVVGAGPAGCSAAIHLKKLGNDVLLVDKSLFPRDKVCGDGIPDKCFPLLAELGIKEESLLERGYSIQKMKIHTPGGEIITYSNSNDNSSSKSICLARKEFDFILLEQAKNILDKIALGMKLIQIKKVSKNTHTLLLEEVKTGIQQEISTRMIVGADGVHSVVSRLNKMLSPGDSDRFIGLRVYCDKDYFAPEIHIIYDKLTLPGYAWIFPISQNKANIGMVVGENSKRQTGRKPVSIFKEIVAKHPVFKGLEKKDLLFDSIKGYPLNLGSAKGSRLKDGVILTGDAAFFTNPLTGGGIYNAMLSGKLAALVSSDCLRKNDLSKEALKKYDYLWKKELSSSFFYSNLMKNCLKKEKLASWWLRCCSKSQRNANIFISIYGKPLPRFGLLNPLFWGKLLMQ